MANYVSAERIAGGIVLDPGADRQAPFSAGRPRVRFGHLCFFVGVTQGGGHTRFDLSWLPVMPGGAGQTLGWGHHRNFHGNGRCWVDLTAWAW